MPAQGRYSREVVERGVQLVHEMRNQSPKRLGVAEEVGKLLGVHPQTLRRWIREDLEHRTFSAGFAFSEAERTKRLEDELVELRRKNSVLKATIAILAAELTAETPELGRRIRDG